MKQFISFVIKEGRHILRDKRTMLILFGMPVVLMLLFGFAITTDVKNVRTVVVTANNDYQSQQAISRLAQSEYFVITRTVGTPHEAERLIRSQQADMAVVFDERHRAIQLIVDGSDPNMAQQWTAYARQTMAPPQSSSLSPVTSHLLYNPQMRSAYTFVPAIMGMLLMLICAMMTSISIVREKERGTMEVLLVSPVRPLMVIIAKAVPYLLLAFAILVTILLMARYVLGVPLAGLAVLDSSRQRDIYPAGTVVGTADIQCGADAAGGTVALCHGAADAGGDAIRHAVPRGVDA